MFITIIIFHGKNKYYFFITSLKIKISCFYDKIGKNGDFLVIDDGNDQYINYLAFKTKLVNFFKFWK